MVPPTSPSRDFYETQVGLEEKKEQKNRVAINLIIYFFTISKGVIRSIAHASSAQSEALDTITSRETRQQTLLREIAQRATLRRISQQAANLARQTFGVTTPTQATNLLSMAGTTTATTRRTATTRTTQSPAQRQPQDQGGNGGGGPGGAGGGGGGGGGGPPGGPQGGQDQQPGNNPTFALTPALVNNDVLDYSDTGTIKTYYRAIEALDPVFDVEGSTLKLFLENVKQRAESFNWSRTLTIIKNGIPLNLTMDYGALTLEDVQAHATSYIGQENRNAQNSFQIYNCLISSLSDAGKAKVVLESNRYSINGVPDGPLLLKIIIQLSHIDTRATVTVIRTRLSSLDTKISQLQDNITEFNEYVKTQRTSLEARGETTNDLLVNLFKGYKAAADSRFVQYIESKEDDYNEGKEVTVESLMELAEAKYRTLVENETWKEPTAEQKKIVALSAQLEQLKKKARTQRQSNNQGNSERSNNNNAQSGNNNNSVNRNRNNSNKKTPWYYQAPKEGEPNTKDVNNKTYYWCPNHGKQGKWVRHKPTECKATGQKNNNSNNQKDDNADKPSLKVNSLAAVVDNDDF